MGGQHHCGTRAEQSRMSSLPCGFAIGNRLGRNAGAIPGDDKFAARVT